jgi:CubicO group peptidase (beta-lactamase class C family)
MSKILKALSFSCLISLAVSHAYVNETTSYFGQIEPGNTANVFAPNLVSKPGQYEYGIGFSDDFTRLYFSTKQNGKNTTYFSALEEGSWTSPQPWTIVEDKIKGDYSTVFNHNRSFMFVTTYTDKKPDKIWSTALRDGEWGELAQVDETVIQEPVSFSSMGSNLDLFLTNHQDNKIYVAPRINRQYPKLQPLDIAYGTNGFISPDLDYLLVHANKNNDPSKDTDILVYFRQEDGSWSEPFDLGTGVNTQANESNPSVTPDGKYLFFNRLDPQTSESDVYWVNTQSIQQSKSAWLASQPKQASKAPEIALLDLDNLSFGAEQVFPNLAKAWIDTSPPDKQDGIEVGKLGAIGEGKSLVLAFAQALAKYELGNYDSLLIAKNNKLIFESYFKKGRANLPHFQASATKGYTTMVLARAMQLGYLSLEDIHKPVTDLLSGLDKDKWAKGVELITLHQAMTMRSGIRVDEDMQRALLDKNRQQKGFDIIQAYLENTASITPDTQMYSYQFSDPTMVMHTVDRNVPGSVMDFVSNQVLGKLGITSFGWRKDVNGVPAAGSGSSLTSRDMLKMGLVVLNKGKWQGEQLFHSELLEMATQAITDPTQDWLADNYQYGYFWYRATVPVQDKSISMTLAWGGGGNRVIVIEELDVVIVLTGHDRNDDMIQEIETRLIPAFMDSVE